MSNTLAAAIAFIVGAIAGVGLSFFAVISGSHGGSTIPLILFDAPILPLPLALRPDGAEYVAMMLIGGGLVYGLYALLVVCSTAPKRTASILLAVHGGSVLLVGVYLSLRVH